MLFIWPLQFLATLKKMMKCLTYFATWKNEQNLGNDALDERRRVSLGPWHFSPRIVWCIKWWCNCDGLSGGFGYLVMRSAVLVFGDYSRSLFRVSRWCSPFMKWTDSLKKDGLYSTVKLNPLHVWTYWCCSQQYFLLNNVFHILAFLCL